MRRWLCFEGSLAWGSADAIVSLVCVFADGTRYVSTRYVTARGCGQVTFGIDMCEGVEVDRTTEKDEIKLVGNSLEAVGTSVSNIQQTCQVKKKDIRKFLDGVYKTSRAIIE